MDGIIEALTNLLGFPNGCCNRV